MSSKVQKAMSTLKRAFEIDPEYAMTWQVSLASAMTSEGVDHETANKAAARFIILTFGVIVK